MKFTSGEADINPLFYSNLLTMHQSEIWSSDFQSSLKPTVLSFEKYLDLLLAIFSINLKIFALDLRQMQQQQQQQKGSLIYGKPAL